METYQRSEIDWQAEKRNRAHGQLNIEFTGGAILFFATVLFLLGTVLANIPKHTSQAEQNRLALISRSVTDKLINNKGFYNDSGSTGTRWEDGTHHEHLESLGLANAYHQLAQDKITALDDHINKTEGQSALGLAGIWVEYNLTLTRLVPFPATTTFQQGNGAEIGVDEPGGIYDNSNMEKVVNYGSRWIDGHTYHLLINRDNSTNEYHYWISQGNKDFATSSDHYNINDKLGGGGVTIGSDAHFYIGQRSGAEAGDSSLIVFQKHLLSHGFQPSPSAENIVQTSRYASLGNDTVKLVLQVWGR